MKRITIFLVIVTGLILFNNKSSAKSGSQVEGGVYFYSSLAPYGNWIQIDGGTTVWQPANIRNDWQPYRDGHWIWTDDGWYWDSYEPFGYITYHYGRWYYDNYYGWIWVPDNQWAPAWVEWRYDDDYIGWSPLPPYAGFSIGIGIRFTTNYYSPYNRWQFVKYRYICDPFVYKYYVSSNNVYKFFGRTRYRTNYGYSNGRVINRGIDIDYVRKRSGQNIRERLIERVNDPGQLRNQNGRNSERVRSYFLDRDKITRENVDQRKIRRMDKRTSLDISRMGIDERRTIVNRSEVRNESRPTNRGNAFNNRTGQLNRRSTNDNQVRSNTRENQVRRGRNINPNYNRERSLQKSWNERPVIRQERKVQKQEINRGNRQIERRNTNRNNSRNKNDNKDKNGRGR